MKLARYDAGAGVRIGLVLDDTMIDLAAGDGDAMINLIAEWDTRKEAIAGAAGSAEGRPLSSVRLLAPVARPGKIFAIGLNYADHIAESKAETPLHQVWFTKAGTSINGPFDPILIAKSGPFVDYEVELVAVIARRNGVSANRSTRTHPSALGSLRPTKPAIPMRWACAASSMAISVKTPTPTTLCSMCGSKSSTSHKR